MSPAAAAAPATPRADTVQRVLANLVTLADFADAADVQPSTVYAYRARGYLPEPVGYVGDTPVWVREQLDTWLAERPGQGRRG